MVVSWIRTRVCALAESFTDHMQRRDDSPVVVSQFNAVSKMAPHGAAATADSDSD
jgi:hypothetical protein